MEGKYTTATRPPNMPSATSPKLTASSNYSSQTISVHTLSSASSLSLTNTHRNPNPSPAPSNHTPDADDGISSPSTLSLTSTFDSTSGSILTFESAQNTNTASEQQVLMSNTIAAARGTGNIWDPEDDEWCDAAGLVETFRATYKAPRALPSPTKTNGLLSGIGTAVKAALSINSTKEEDEMEIKIREKIEELGNTYFYNANGDANDKVMKYVFDKPTRYFPGGTAPRNMHIIDLDAFFCTTDALLQYARPRLCDAVATILSHTNHACLEAFLNPLVKEFVFRRKVDNNEGGLILVIRREGYEVICGAYRNLGFKMLWKVYMKSMVGITGEWYEVFAALRTGEMVIDKGLPEWGIVQTGGKGTEDEEVAEGTTEGVQRKLELSPSKKTVKASAHAGETDPKLMLYQSRVLATHLLWDIWYRFDKKYECRATWTADGEESIVRLSRSVIGSGEEED